MLPSIKFWRAPHVLNTYGKPCICANLALLSVSGNFWAALELIILAGVSSIEFFCYAVLDFLSLVLPHTHLLSPGQRYNASSTSNSTDIRASEELGHYHCISCSASCSFKVKNCCFKNSLSFSIFSCRSIAAFAQLECALPHHYCLLMFSYLGFFFIKFVYPEKVLQTWLHYGYKRC